MLVETPAFNAEEPRGPRSTSLPQWWNDQDNGLQVFTHLVRVAQRGAHVGGAAFVAALHAFGEGVDDDHLELDTSVLDVHP